MKSVLVAITVAAVISTPLAATPVAIDAVALAQLENVQRTINALPMRSDQDRFGRVEYWQSADATGGDCEDKALAARDALVALGWSAKALRLALAWDETGIYHAVLTVDVQTAGDVPLAGVATTYVLDSRFAKLRTWSALSRRGYRWSVRQSETNGWQRIGS